MLATRATTTSAPRGRYHPGGQVYKNHGEPERLRLRQRATRLKGRASATSRRTTSPLRQRSPQRHRHQAIATGAEGVIEDVLHIKARLGVRASRRISRATSGQAERKQERPSIANEMIPGGVTASGRRLA